MLKTINVEVGDTIEEAMHHKEKQKHLKEKMWDKF
jgi:hypothetical protein